MGTRRVLSALFVGIFCGAWALADTTVRGPLQPGGEIPDRTGQGHFWYIYEFCVTESATIVQHVTSKIRMTCMDDNRLLAENSTDYWEYWAFTRKCCSKDQHATEVTQTIDQMRAAATALNLEIQCRCYRMEVEMTFDLYSGTATPTTASVVDMEDRCGTFGIPAAPAGQAPTSRWRIKDGNGWKDGPDPFQGGASHTITFDASTKKSVVHRATYYSGDCPNELRPAQPGLDGYR